jgi:hypothetical protein
MLIVMRGSEDAADSEREVGLLPVAMEIKNVSNLVREEGSDTIKGFHE